LKSIVFESGKENNIYRHNTKIIRAYMFEVLEGIHLVAFLISCYDFTYQALRTITHSVAVIAFFILSSYKSITYRPIAGRN